MESVGHEISAHFINTTNISLVERTSPKTDRLLRWGLTLFGVGLAFWSGFTLGGIPTVQGYVAIATQPSDEKTNELWAPDPNSYAGKMEAELQANPLIKKLQAEGKWTVSRPHLKIPAHLKAASFTGGHLLADDKIPVPPIVFSAGDGKELVSVIYLGKGVCGHPGIVHGGLLATLMDEGLARTCFAALPNKVGVTANLNIDYRAPCMAGQWVVLKGETTKVEGRKAWVTGRIETLPKDGSQGRVCVEGHALFIEPRGFATKLMKITS